MNVLICYLRKDWLSNNYELVFGGLLSFIIQTELRHMLNVLCVVFKIFVRSSLTALQWWFFDSYSKLILAL